VNNVVFVQKQFKKFLKSTFYSLKTSLSLFVNSSPFRFFAMIIPSGSSKTFEGIDLTP